VNAALHADAVRVLTVWNPPDEPAATTRARMLELLDAGPRVMDRDGGPAHFTASALVLDAALEEVLLCLHRRVARWVQLGGHCEPGDRTMAAAALREATEESGIPDLMLLPVPIDIDIHPVRCAAGESHHFDVRYVAVAPPGAAARLSAECADLAWFPTGELPTPLAHRTAILIPPALQALRDHEFAGTTRERARPATP
jgi:8-oxo-dGTP pyrophosphatase MutT (NUDIX family)